MKSLVAETFTDDFTNLKLVEKPIPSANATHCVVRVFSAAINPIDAKIAQGFAANYQWPISLPLFPGYDAAGVIHELPESYEGPFKAGDRVFTCNWGVGRHWDNDSTSQGGAFAEYALFPMHKIAKLPDAVAFDTGAASTLVGLTAYQGLFESLSLKPGQKILVLGAAGAVGTIVMQLAKNTGCWVAGTSSPRNLAFVSQFHPDKIIDYTHANWWEDPELKGIDCIYDAVGSPGFFTQSHENHVVKEGGAMVSILFCLTGFEEHAGKYASLTNFGLHHSGEQLALLGEMIAAGKLTIPIADAFELTVEGAVAMYSKQASGKSSGKNVLRIATA